MAFEPTSPKTPDDIGAIDIRLTIRPDGQGGVLYDADFHLDVVAVDATIVDEKAGDLTPHLTSQQVTQIKTFLDNMRAKAIAEVLP